MARWSEKPRPDNLPWQAALRPWVKAKCFQFTVAGTQKETTMKNHLLPCRLSGRVNLLARSVALLFLAITDTLAVSASDEIQAATVASSVPAAVSNTVAAASTQPEVWLCAGDRITELLQPGRRVVVCEAAPRRHQTLRGPNQQRPHQTNSSNLSGWSRTTATRLLSRWAAVSTSGRWMTRRASGQRSTNWPRSKSTMLRAGRWTSSTSTDPCDG